MVYEKAILRLWSCLSVALSWLLIIQGMQTAGYAQDSTLEVAVLQGNNLNNEVEEPATWEVAVQVRDRQGNRVKGAVVFFQIPSGFGSFAGGAASIAVMTDDDGVARIRGFRRGSLTGGFVITATASYQGQTGTARIDQTNARGGLTVVQKSLILSAVSVAAGIGVYFAATKNNHTTSVSLGSATVTPAFRASGLR